MNYIEYDEKDIQSFEYETTMVSDGNIIGTCELGKAEIQMLNDSNGYSSLKESWIQTVHGSFYIYDVAPVQEKVNIKLSCYDIKYKLDKPYDSSKHKFPCTLKTWRNSIFDDCGVVYDNSDFPNSNLLLEEEPYIESSSSNRQVIQVIAQAGASAVVTDENDCFFFKWFEDVIHTVEDWTELTTEKESSIPVNTIVLGRGNTEDNVYYPEQEPTKKVEFRIDNNYILDPQDVTSTQDRRYQTRIPIYNQVNGFSYLIFSMRTQNIENKLSVKLGQKIKYLDIYDNELTAYIMSKKITYLGGNMRDDDNYEITLSAEKINETSTDLSYGSSVINDILRVERKTDKNKGTIEDTIEKQGEQQKQITQISQTVDTIQQQVSGEYGMDREVTGTNQIFIEDAMKYSPLELKITGYSDLSRMLYPSFYLGANTVPIAYKEKSLSIITLCIDSQDREHQTENLKEYPITITEPLRSLGTVKDELFITIEEGELKTQITRYLGYTGSQIVKLDKPVIETITCPKIELLEHENYVYIKEQPNYQIYIKYLIYSTLNIFYMSRVEAKTLVKQTESSILEEVSLKADDNEIKTLVEKTAGELNIELSKKTDKDKLVASINASVEGIKILANKLELSALDILNIIAGSEINLTAQDISMIADKFKIDKTGHAEFNDIYITGGKIVLGGTEENPEFYFVDPNDLNSLTKFGPNWIYMSKNGKGIQIVNTLSKPMIGLSDGSLTTFVRSDLIETPVLTQTSLESIKKNFEHFENGLSLIEKTDIYKYHLKSQDDDDKKHIGLVIGDNYRTPNELIHGDAIDQYAMISVAWQAIKELSERVKKLEKENEVLRVKDKILASLVIIIIFLLFVIVNQNRYSKYDLNRDGKVDLTDLLELQRYYIERRDNNG